jgi:hypothetical protein
VINAFSEWGNLPSLFRLNLRFGQRFAALPKSARKLETR